MARKDNFSFEAALAGKKERIINWRRDIDSETRQNIQKYVNMLNLCHQQDSENKRRRLCSLTPVAQSRGIQASVAGRQGVS
jgi:hypothetical protein